MGDDDSRKNKKRNPEKKGFNNVLNAGDVLQSTWIRCAIQDGDGLDRFLLDYGCNFLLYFSAISWLIFLSQ